MKIKDEEHTKIINKIFLDELNRELHHAELDIKKFRKLSKNTKNFIKNQETLDGNIKKTRGNNYDLLKRVAHLSEHGFEGVTVSADLKSILKLNTKHKPHFFVEMNLNQKIGETPVHMGIKAWMDDFRHAISSKENMTLTNNQTLNRKRRKEKMSRPIEAALNHHKRILVVRVDLAYSDYNSCNRDISEDLSKLTKNMKRNKSLSGGLIIGFSKIEFGITKGPHAHLLMVYDGNTRWRDDRIGDLLGCYWKNIITAGEGTHFNANRKKSKERLSIRTGIPANQLGIGMLKKGDDNRIKNLDFVIDYLSKDDQRIISQPGMRLRSFRTFTTPTNRG